MKKIRKTKILYENEQWRIAMQAHDLAQDISMALERKIRIIQLDEYVVSKQTMKTHAWTNKKTNIIYDLSKIYTRPKAVILAVSREYGLDLV